NEETNKVICKLVCFLKHVQCSFSEIPVLFKQELQSEEVKEGKQVKLTCELSKPDTPVKWMKGDTVLYASEKYEFKQHGTVAELIIRDVKSIDA
ncbi:OBSCN protein, partial [Chauna torquata]|nr:OBSCN protein [Chauna torquata]